MVVLLVITPDHDPVFSLVLLEDGFESTTNSTAVEALQSQLRGNIGMVRVLTFYHGLGLLSIDFYLISSCSANQLVWLNIDGKDLRVLKNIYWEQEAAVRVDNNISQYRPICRGVRQDCMFSTDLFKCSEIILRNIENHEGIIAGGHNINNLKYTVDTVIIADSEEKMQTILTTVTEESEKKRLQLNAKKIECMKISKKELYLNAT
ncbi:endonuclease-reverse transcriptase [Plakobranchus ocellatus]|uniref:Endonuclease-reverse transcriptase n=1 Tax=Plakobranchus ocellatus TaxID=259542 RepID=A0AAV3YGK2_9GAST|nr:endonuclease-reverse transcriptase [Plakobranchus ocellatus]